MGRKYIQVFDSNYSNPYPDDLVEFRDLLNRIIKKIPSAHLADSEIELDTEYDSAAVTVRIGYFRESTKEELDAELSALDRAKTAARERDLRVLAELKAKYEPSS